MIENSLLIQSLFNILAVDNENELWKLTTEELIPIFKSINKYEEFLGIKDYDDLLDAISQYSDLDDFPINIEEVVIELSMFIIVEINALWDKRIFEYPETVRKKYFQESVNQFFKLINMTYNVYENIRMKEFSSIGNDLKKVSENLNKDIQNRIQDLVSDIENRNENSELFDILFRLYITYIKYYVESLPK